MYMRFTDIIAAQKLPLGEKIRIAVEQIGEGFAASAHNQAVAYSGGKDSLVLLDLICTHFPDRKPYVIFGNTGIEFPESLKFARESGKRYVGERFVEARPAKLEKDGLKYAAQVEVLKWLVESGCVRDVLKDDGKLKSTDALERAATPEMWEDFRRRRLVWRAGTRKTYWWCCDQYGYPILGKAASKLGARRINIDCFLQFSESSSEKPELLEYYDLLRNVKISQMCCHILKKEPSEIEQARLDVDVIFKGLMAEESHSRMVNFSTRGYIFKSSRPHLGDDPFYHVNPLSIWTDADIWEYIRSSGIPYSPLYDIEYTTTGKDGKSCKQCIKRNGCIGCATDIAYKDNHISVLRQTHPRAWRVIMNGGMGDELRKLKAHKTNGKTTILDTDYSTDEVLDVRPCAFDELPGQMVMDDLTLAGYDPEEIDEEVLVHG